MKLECTEDIKETLKDIQQLFEDIETSRKQIENDIETKNAIQEDYLHELELSKLNGIEIMGVAKSLIQTRKERRILKDRLELVNTIKGYTDKYITKGIIADTKQVIKNIETLENNQKIREYTPRIIKNLKCAKKKEKQSEIL